MCSHFLKRMENYQGDLVDILRATATSTHGGSAAVEVSAAAVIPDWQIPSNTIHYSEDFGDPFNYMMRDPAMQSMDSPVSAGFFCNSNIINGGVEESGSINLAHGVDDDDERIRRPSNIFSRMLQISPNAKLPMSSCHSQAPAESLPPPPPPPPRGLKGPPILVPNNRALVERPGLQISSPRNTGIKRRKCQAKKVVCIPAPAPANSRSSGEVVPSDLWAWRKYGQKPIKGSPYPRGYYRCSSSKGCSARKQVERSRTDPNTLVITYTSEHNHPWPTQRNALAGSSRSQPSKNSSAAKDSPPNYTNKKQDQKEISTENSGAVKEETDRDHFDNGFEIEDAEFDEGFPQTYKPMLEDSFYADLGEIEADPLNLLFTQGFPHGDSGRENNDLDQFSFYDWATNCSNSTGAAATTVPTVDSAEMCGESNRNS